MSASNGSGPAIFTAGFYQFGLLAGRVKKFSETTAKNAASNKK